MGRILAIDYGRKRTGLAVTDELKLIATTLGAIPTADLVIFLKEYISINPVECFVVGEPKRLDNSPSEVEAQIKSLISRLLKVFPGIRIERMDERFTSMIAGQTILASGRKKMARRDKKTVDAVSATIILQSYMEKEKIINERRVT